MIDTFESTARTFPNKVFLTYVDASGKEASYTYRQARLIAAAMAIRLRGKGVHRGDFVSVDLPNCAEYVLLALAAAYGSFTLVCLNHRLTSSEKISRVLDLEREGMRIACRVDLERVTRLVNSAHAILSGAGRQASRSRLGVEQDAIGDVVHFAERSAHLFDARRPAIVMFTSGTTGRAKAVSLTWEKLSQSSRISNRMLSERGSGMWQAVLPLYHIGGFQVLVRSIENWTPLRLYARFSPQRVLEDARAHSVTHISVVDKMLQDLLANDTRKTISRYQCILLGGGPINPQTLEHALEANARVWASYGMTETASHIANELVTPAFAGGLRLMPGYSARIVDPDVEGFGRLAVKGPGVFSGYLNARAAFTVDGFFLTGDTAALHDGRIFMRERTADMFISGGENVYPAEITDALLRQPGISGAHVFGVPDSRWGRRPVAIVERREGCQLSPQQVRAALKPVLSKIYQPKHICIVDELPRAGIGKIDRARTEELYEKRIEVSKVALYHIRVPFKTPFATARGTLGTRDSLIIEITDAEGRVGLGECVSFLTNWYLPETLPDDARILHDVLSPLVLRTAFLHPREAWRAFAAEGEAASYPMACAAMEMALWDLYGKIEEKPLWQLIREEYERLGGSASGASGAVVQGACAKVAAGAVLGMGTPEQTVDSARACVAEGYRRVKLKVAPGKSIESVRAVRASFPQLFITLDANQSFGLNDIDELRAYDNLSIGWIEEPLDMSGAKLPGRSDPFARLAGLQRLIKTPICLDESFKNAAEAHRALTFPELKWISVKIGKFGGIQPALEFIVKAQSLGRKVWMGGMYDTGISKRMHAAFEALPGIVVPGDVGAVSRYFNYDITKPHYDADRGCVVLNEEGHECGLGCELDHKVLTKLCLRSTKIEFGA